MKSAIENPFSTMFEQELYPTDEEKIAMTVYSLINNHGFEDANKRTGILVLRVLLAQCRIFINATEEEFVDLAKDIALSYDKYDIVNWINQHKII